MWFCIAHSLAPDRTSSQRTMFTTEAQKEANRDGVPPIELIDGERLVSLFEKYELVPEFFRSFES
jgi:restriction endonuclease Mrr